MNAPCFRGKKWSLKALHLSSLLLAKLSITLKTSFFLFFPFFFFFLRVIDSRIYSFNITLYNGKEEKKKGQIMASSFSYKTLARVRATQLHLKRIVTKDILTIFSQIDLISFKIQRCLKNTSFLKNTSYPKKGELIFFFFFKK